MQYFVFPADQCVYRGFSIRDAEEAASRVRGGLICEIILPNEGPRATLSSASPERGQPIAPSSHPERRRETCETP